MALTKERKIYVGLLLTGVAALALDRLTAGPQGARAQEDASAFVVDRSEQPAPTGAAPVPAAATEPTAVGPDLSIRLRELGDGLRPQSHARDLFRAPAAWAPKTAAAPIPQGPVTDPTGPALEFERSHKLTAILFSGRQRHAVVDGKMIIPGQSIDGFTLISVTQESAVFRSGTATAVLRPDIKGP